ncbi:aminotransferase class V-fold PLP-dependent enzyme [Corynebacterium sp. 320]|uniref:aminotransferase class V-fold PLP-dependent enzyme n=1 Tax=Corynebacterium TaxID=1716 RepID=UPI00125CCCB3|nr:MULTISPECIES: aminotransferase class V-fold PLP-dependent enzyme [Corynebacterium]KAB1502743.1 aminotransferase class V-fold PLP-dependent enzyme [Corynebacterium sp. 320]KAB1550519.1 aminotransferase class V-fold PLP-dependent enzyme [Corynebacterium sp. 319]KAB1554753.1 aminotransferase class V-fold PLP-dependent enzyme [Corynebacterium sp. 321]KAB3526406.1 aminotransferase class V-fold PLP-dependent enzyme [Corynebacterium sp. 250]KAB3537749.1 aminotransferase class V-fold PLP-dependent 
MFDNPRVRGLYASLSDGWTYVNAQSHPQVPEKVSAAVARAFRVSNLQQPIEVGSGFHSRTEQPGRRLGETFEHAARVAAADLVGGRPECVILGPSRAALLDGLAQVMGHKLRLGQEVVLSRVDDPANITPWTRAADLFGAHVRWAEPELATGALPSWQFAELVGEHTALVAVGAANRHVGAVNDIPAITGVVRKKTPQALVVVDVDNIAPYRVIDLPTLGADVVAVDIASLGGPQIGALVFHNPEVMDRLRPFGGRSLRTVLEIGGVSEGLLGGVPEAVEHLASLDGEARGTRRRRLETTLPQVNAYTGGLARRAVEGLQALGTVHVVGVDGDFHANPSFDNIDRIPRVTFIVDAVPADVAQQRLVAHGVVADVVRPSQSELLRVMGVFGDPEMADGGRRARRVRPGRHSSAAAVASVDDPYRRAAWGEEPADEAGAVTLSFSPHNTAYDVDQVIRAVASLA